MLLYFRYPLNKGIRNRKKEDHDGHSIKIRRSGDAYYSEDPLDDSLLYAAAEHYGLTILQFSDFTSAGSELMQRELHEEQQPVLIAVTKPHTTFGEAVCEVLGVPDLEWEHYTIYSPLDSRDLALYYAPKSIEEVEASCQQYYILDLGID